MRSALFSQILSSVLSSGRRSSSAIHDAVLRQTSAPSRCGCFPVPSSSSLPCSSRTWSPSAPRGGEPSESTAYRPCTRRRYPCGYAVGLLPDTPGTCLHGPPARTSSRGRCSPSQSRRYRSRHRHRPGSSDHGTHWLFRIRSEPWSAPSVKTLTLCVLNYLFFYKKQVPLENIDI